MFFVLKHQVLCFLFEIQCINSNEILFSLLQGGNTTTLSTWIGHIESKLFDITNIVAQVLETCNENVKFVQCLNTTILETSANDGNGYKKSRDKRTNFGKWNQPVSYDGTKIIAFLEG